LLGFSTVLNIINFSLIFLGGMIESRQDVIEINDCEFDVFKG